MSTRHKYGAPSAPTRVFRRVVERDGAILWLLAAGDVSDPSGRAVHKLNAMLDRHPKLSKVSTSTLTHILARLEADNLLIRNTSGKRTYDISLAVTKPELVAMGHNRNPWTGVKLVDEPDTKIVLDLEAPAPIPEPEPVELPLVLDAPEPVIVEEPDADVIPMWEAPTLPLEADPHALLAVAVTFIAQAISVSKPAGEVPMPDVLERLSLALEDNQRLRNRNSQIGEELAAVKAERDGLRKAKNVLEQNLRTIATGRLDEGALRRFRELDGLVRSAPGSAKGA